MAARCLEDKKALDILVFDVSAITTIADYFVIATGEAKRQIKACSDYVDEILASKGANAHHLEGISNLEWVLMDYGDVIIHIFDEDTREYYGLERLWGDAPEVDYRVKKRKAVIVETAEKKSEVRRKK
ncbi:MAG: ribosome silencing factor [Nitrospirae bacterium]|nr:ribosome silencing factor [Nitrospirota bacterium]